eukprot:3757786-Pyramimonas_sp.AAC.2
MYSYLGNAEQPTESADMRKKNEQQGPTQRRVTPRSRQRLHGIYGGKQTRNTKSNVTTPSNIIITPMTCQHYRPYHSRPSNKLHVLSVRADLLQEGRLRHAFGKALQKRHTPHNIGKMNHMQDLSLPVPY